MLQLFNGKTAKCSTEFNSLEKIAINDDGVIVINYPVPKIMEDNITQIVNGTYLILFDIGITINDTDTSTLKA